MESYTDLMSYQREMTGGWHPIKTISTLDFLKTSEWAAAGVVSYLTQRIDKAERRLRSYEKTVERLSRRIEEFQIQHKNKSAINPDGVVLPEKNVGGIYFVFAESGHIKIGRASCIRSRFQVLNGSTPVEYRLVAYIRSAATRTQHGDVEIALHRRFDHLRVRNEWFLASAELMNFVQQIAVNQSKPGFQWEALTNLLGEAI